MPDANPADFSEAQARRLIIDPRLRAAGWALQAASGGPARTPAPVALTEYPTDDGDADYVLFSGGQALAVLEAKKPGRGGGEGVLSQAERYGRGLADGAHDFDGIRVPFLFSTNGTKIYFRDVRHPLNR